MSAISLRRAHRQHLSHPASVVSSLSVSSVSRLMDGAVATRLTIERFYDETEWRAVVCDAKSDASGSYMAHFIPAIGD